VHSLLHIQEVANALLRRLLPSQKGVVLDYLPGGSDARLKPSIALEQSTGLLNPQAKLSVSAA
jgi:hypothetical protein